MAKRPRTVPLRVSLALNADQAKAISRAFMKSDETAFAAWILHAALKVAREVAP